MDQEGMKVTIEDSPSGIILKVVPRIEDLAGADAGTLEVEKIRNSRQDEIRR